MGAEGTLWVGLQSFVDVPHAFQNLGDGTYFHSGILAVRRPWPSGANMTYKLLYNDAVAMTGGQPIDGKLSSGTWRISFTGKGCGRSSSSPMNRKNIRQGIRWPEGTTIRHRRGTRSRCRRSWREVKGVSSGIVYDQTCAAEKRRRRKRGTFPIREARLHQPGSVRRLRRLQREVELRQRAAARNRVRSQAQDRSVELQQGLQLPQGFLSVVRHRVRRRVAEGASRERAGRAAGISHALPEPHAAGMNDGLQRPRHRHRRHGRADRGRDARYGRAPRPQGLQRHGYHGHGAEGRLW